MIGYLPLVMLVALAVALLWSMKLRGSMLTLVGAALAFGSAGYALQGSPGLAGQPRVADKLAGVAEQERLPLQPAGLGRGASNDANPIQLTRAGVATAALGLPLRYMHSPVEVVSLSDLDHAAELLAKFVLAVEPGEDFTPRLE